MGLVVHETGSNTSMKGDGNGQNANFVTCKDKVPSIRAYKCDNHFIAMCFTALNGEPVLCVAVFKGKSVNNVVHNNKKKVCT